MATPPRPGFPARIDLGTGGKSAVRPPARPAGVAGTSANPPLTSATAPLATLPSWWGMP